MYRIIQQNIPQGQRKEINEKVIFSIDTDNKTISQEAVYNCYTGWGGLHGLSQKDYANYYEFSVAKKKIEQGQFFTPHNLCRDIAALLAPGADDMVLDMCCGMGNFFNFMPNQHNCFGFDCDESAVKVAQYLYPDATINKCDIRFYNPPQRFDILVGNPPFNLDWDKTLSQYYYMKKAYSVLLPAGLLLFIVPASFIENENWEKSKVTAINRDFSFLGQTKLPDNVFSISGIESYATKIMAFQRESEHIEMRRYDDFEFVSWEELGKRIINARETKNKLRIQIGRELNLQERKEEEQFNYQYKKYLYELKTHTTLQKHVGKSIALFTKYKNQQPPENCTPAQYKEWEKNKITPQEVLKTIFRYIKKQNIIPRKEIALVKTAYSFKLKAYAPRLLGGVKVRSADMIDLILERRPLPVPDVITPAINKQLRKARKIIRRKQREYDFQSQEFQEMQRVPEIDSYLDCQTFVNNDMEDCRFTDIQKQDMGLFFQKKYSLLNWQQGSGKTAAVYFYAKYLLKHNKVRNALVLAPAIAIDLTWVAFLKRNNESFRVLRSWKDFQDIPEKTFLVVSTSMIDRLKWYLKRLVKTHSQKICLIFDESDEITNPGSVRTKAILNLFKRTKFKILATGTTTRNNINELYPQLNLLYNNSINMISWCPYVYYENKNKEIEEEQNPYFAYPFPVRGGVNLFKACFCPGKITVFGIEKQNQDLYNKDELFDIINKTIITRKFREFAGEKYSIKTHVVDPSDAEKDVYRVIVEEFYRICELYFTSTGDSKKEAGLRLIRQIKLLIRACSTPNKFDEYVGNSLPNKTKAIKRLINKIPGLVTVGVTSLQALTMYEEYFREQFPDRPLFVIQGSCVMVQRQKLIEQFQNTCNGILLCTQQSLKSSVNIPQCNQVIVESLQWNIPKMEQFYFRFIRLDSKQNTTVHYVTNKDSIEQNLMALVLTKERLNEFIKTGEVKEQSEIFEEFNISMSVIESLLKREQDAKGKFHITWGSQRIV